MRTLEPLVAKLLDFQNYTGFKNFNPSRLKYMSRFFLLKYKKVTCCDYLSIFFFPVCTWDKQCITSMGFTTQMLLGRKSRLELPQTDFLTVQYLALCLVLSKVLPAAARSVAPMVSRKEIQSEAHSVEPMVFRKEMQSAARSVELTAFRKEIQSEARSVASMVFRKKIHSVGRSVFRLDLQWGIQWPGQLANP